MMNPGIVSNRQICGGEPEVKGARVTAHIILSHLAAGDDFETVLMSEQELCE